MVKNKDRLTKEVWLEKALEVLWSKGSSKLHIAELSKSLGVSKGSFYWHFKDRSDFILAIVEYWSESFTTKVKTGANASADNAYDRLRYLLNLVSRDDLSRFDAIFDSWAAHEPEIADRVYEAHRCRHNYIKSLLAELGFEGEDLALRTQVFVGFMKYRFAKGLGFKRRENPGSLDSQLKFLVGGTSGG